MQQKLERLDMDIKQKHDLTYSEKILELIKIGIKPYQVCYTGPGPSIETKKESFYTRDEAVKYVETLISQFGQTEDFISAENFYEFQNLENSWTIYVYDLYPQKEGTEDIGRKEEFLFGRRYGAARIANPDSKVFVWYGGRDCDGYTWHNVKEYKTLTEAAEDCESVLQSADGPTSWQISSQDSFEWEGHGENEAII